MKPAHIAWLIGMNLLWAGTCPIYKVLAEGLDSGTIATLRFGLAAVGLLAAWRWLPGRGPLGRDLAKALLMGVVVFCAAPRLQIEGVHRGMAGDTALLIALDPLIVALAAAVFLRERIAPRRWWGFSLGMLGVMLISQGREPLSAMAGMGANLLFIASFVCEGAYSVMGKPLLARVGALKLLSTALLGGTAMNLALEWRAGGAGALGAVMQLPAQTWIWLFYMALICTIAGYTLWYVVIREAEVNVATLTVFIQPVAGLAMAAVWLGEPLHWGQLRGSLVIAAGLIIGLRLNNRAPAGWNYLRLWLSRRALGPAPLKAWPPGPLPAADSKEIAEPTRSR